MDRRAFLSAAALAPAALTVPALATPFDPISPYWCACHAYNGHMIEEKEFLDALDAVVRWKPRTAEDFIQKFLVLCDDGGLPRDDLMINLWRDARRVAA